MKNNSKPETYQDIAEKLHISISRVLHLIAEGLLTPTQKGVEDYRALKKHLSLNDKIKEVLKPEGEPTNQK